MKKPILHGIGNAGRFNYYIFDKNREVIEILSEIFERILDLEWPFYEYYSEKKEKSGVKKRNFRNIRDFHERIDNITLKNVRADVFYGNKEMFVIIHCPQNLRKKLNDDLMRIFKMPKSKKKSWVIQEKQRKKK